MSNSAIKNINNGSQDFQEKRGVSTKSHFSAKSLNGASQICKASQNIAERRKTSQSVGHGRSIGLVSYKNNCNAWWEHVSGLEHLGKLLKDERVRSVIDERVLWYSYSWYEWRDVEMMFALRELREKRAWRLNKREKAMLKDLSENRSREVRVKMLRFFDDKFLLKAFYDRVAFYSSCLYIFAKRDKVREISDSRGVNSLAVQYSINNNKDICFVVAGKSRWDRRQKSYRRHVRKRLEIIFNEVSDKDECVLLTLSLSPKRLKEKGVIDDDLGMIGSCVLKIWSLWRRFYNRLKRWAKRNNKEFKFVVAVLEFQKNGLPHLHVIFAGKYLAPLEVLQKYWEWSEPHGIDVKFIKGKIARRYVFKYITKMDRYFDGGTDMQKIACFWLWYFGVRTYNFAHHGGGFVFMIMNAIIESVWGGKKVKEWICVGMIVHEIIYIFRKYRRREIDVGGEWWHD